MALHRQGSIVDMKSQWVGESLIRTVTRHVGKKNKILVEVTEYAPRHTSKRRASKLAMEAARRVGCPSVDSITLSDQEIVRESRNLHTDEPVRTKIRSTTFAFDGVE